jgi:hypothetical protein
VSLALHDQAVSVTRLLMLWSASLSGIEVP